MPPNAPPGRLRLSLGRPFSWFCLLLVTGVIALTSCGPLFAAPFDSAAQPPAASPLKLLRITPSGDDVPPGQEIVFQFDRPVVPLGRMERNASEVPITITPAPGCQWRWLNPSALACRLDKKDRLKEATRYSITVSPGLKAEDGSTLSAQESHSFVTERPKVSYSSFKIWQGPGQPLISLHFNQAVEEASVAKCFYFQTADGPRIDPQVSEDPDLQQSKDYRKGITWLLTPKTPLPIDRSVQLQAEPGLIPVQGGEPGVDRRSVVSFHTFPEFRFLGVECQDAQGKTLSIRAGGNAGQQPRCMPPWGVSLLFSAPVSKDEVGQAIQVEPPPRRKTEEDPWEDVYTDSRLSEPHQKSDTYQVPIPESFIRPFTQYRLRAKGGSMKDEFGRALSGAIDMSFMTDHLAPDLTLPKRLPVLEKGLDTDVAIYSTNLAKIRLKYESTGPGGWNPSKNKQLDVPTTKDVVAPIPLKIRSLIGKPSGLLRGHLTHEPRARGEDGTPLWFLAQVTPFHVHVKLGHFNTLVWVTDLQSGQPVQNATISVSKGRFEDLGLQSAVLARATTDAGGLATLPGTQTLDPQLELYEAFDPDQPRLIFRCERGGDIAVLPMTYDFSVAAEGSNHDYIPEAIRPKHGHLRSWGTTAQGIYKLGDTVQYKIYIRDQDNKRFVAPPGAHSNTPPSQQRQDVAPPARPSNAPVAALPQKAAPGRPKPEPAPEPSKPAESLYTLKVHDPGDKVIFERADIRLSEFGAMDGEFVIPKTGTVGWYRFTLSTNFTKDELEPMRVLVSDFTPSPFKVTTDLKGTSFGLGDPVEVTTRAALHAGGPYTSAKTRITAVLKSEPFKPTHPAARGFEFDVVKSGDYETPPTSTIFETRTTLDDQGASETRFEIPDSPILYGRLSVESAVQDDRGKHVANRAGAVYFGRNLYVGLSQTDWILEEGRPADTRVIVVNRNGEPVPGMKILATVERRETKAARVKEAGDAYVPQYVHEWTPVESRDLVSAPEAIAFDWKPPQAGYYRVTVRIAKDGGEAPREADSEAAAEGHQTSISRYATGKSYVLWESVPGNLLDVKPEKDTVKVGETARFLVQNPFPGMKGLVTLERYGVMESWVKSFETSTEVIEIPVKPEYLPGFYLSVMVMSPRVDKPVSEEGEDLGKPTFRMGYAQIKVQDTYKEITVQARPQREVYKPRDKVLVDLEAVVKHPVKEGSRPPIELAIAVLDESVFDLLPGRKVFDPYQGFYTLDSLDLANYNLIMQLVGRQELEKKGADPGGGGGPDLAMRSVFKFVSYWNPSIPVDKDGKAKIEFEVPDNLTGWRILAIAMTPDDQMGLGEGSFKVNQPTEIRPVLPNQILDGDRFEAGFSIMNRTDAPRTLQVSLEAQGPLRAGGQAAGAAPDTTAKPEHRIQAAHTLQVDPFKRVTVRMPVQAAGAGTITFTAQAGDDKDRDSVRFQVPVLRRQAKEIAAVYGTTTSPEVSESVLFPENMLVEYSQLSVSLSPSVISGLEGAFGYMRTYPYSCWEQKLTKGVMAAFYKQLKPYVSKTFEWNEAAGLPAKTLQLAAEYQAPNGGMAYYAPKDSYVDPYLSAYTALAFGWLRTAGFTPPQPMESKLHGYLEGLLQRNVNAEFYTKGMMATVRATAMAALADAGKLQKADLERFENAIPEMSLFGKALFLQATAKVPGASKVQQKILTSLLAQSSQSAGTLFFTETLDARFRCLLTSTLRDNAALLSALVAAEASSTAGQTQVRDIPLRLMRAVTQARKGRDRWSSTQDNVFAVRALADFSRLYEKTPPSMTVQASLDQESFGKAELKVLSSPPTQLEYRPKSTDPGRKAKVRIERSGEGRLYYGVNLHYETAPAAGGAEARTVNAGIEVHREYSVEREGKWILLEGPAELKTGELVRVDLYVGVPAERHFVVVQDPLPGGLEPVNRDLATASTVDAAKSQPTYAEKSYWHRYQDWLVFGYSRWSFYFRELRHDAARFYSEILPAGHYHLSYVAQAIAPGEFTAQPTYAEEMYDPDVFGKGTPTTMRIRAAE